MKRAAPSLAVIASLALFVGWTQNNQSDWLKGIIYAGSGKVQLTDATGNLVTAGNISTTGNVAIGGTLAVTGATTLRSTLAVTGAETVGGTLTVTGNEALTGTLAVTGATTLRSTLSVSGTLTGATGTFAGQLSGAGTPTGDAAAAGIIGQTLSLSRVRSAAVALTSGTVCNVGAATCPATGGTQSITLTPGDWDCRGAVGFLTGTATSVSALNVSISKTSNTLSASDTGAVPTAGEIRMLNTFAAEVPANASTIDVSIPSFRVAVSVNTTIYLVASATFTVSTLSTYGSLECRRMR